MRLLVTGAGGLLGGEVVRRARAQNMDVVACDRAALDITNPQMARDVVARAQPDVVVHCAAFTNVDAAELDRDTAFRVNVDGTENVAHAAASSGARLIAVSTDYVFDGESEIPYALDASPNPLNVYGASKLAGEEAARAAGDWIVARVSWVYGPGGTNFGSRLLERARAGETLRAFTDMQSVPTFVGSAADALLRLAAADIPSGIHHANCKGVTTWYDFACEALRIAGIDARVESSRVADVELPARRPRFSALDVSATEAVIGPIEGWREALNTAVQVGL